MTDTEEHPEAGYADIVDEVRTLLEKAKEAAAVCDRGLDAARARLAQARVEADTARSRVRQLARALAVLQQPLAVGRPRGSGNPAGTRAAVSRLLPTRPEWTGRELRAVLADEGTDVKGNEVSAALSWLRVQGHAIRLGRGRWSAIPTDRSEP